MHKPKSIRPLHSDVCFPYRGGERETLPPQTEDAILQTASSRLSVPTPQAFPEIHARARTLKPLPVPNGSMLLVTLFDPTTDCARRVESLNAFSDDQMRRLEVTLHSFGRNPQFDDDERVWRVCWALQRVPLGTVGISAAALAAFPAQFLYGLLMFHRRRPEKLWSEGIPPLDCRAVFTSICDSNGERRWPSVEISTGSDATVTLIALVDELRKQSPDDQPRPKWQPTS